MPKEKYVKKPLTYLNNFITDVSDDGTIITKLPPDPDDVFLDVTDGIEMSVADSLS